MRNLKFKNQEIVDTFQNKICENHDEAIEMGIEYYGWNEGDMLDRTEKVTFELESGEIVDTKLDCIMIDPGSEDSIFYLHYD